jgi:hypothetical protein
MKSFFELRESAKQLSEKTMELAGVTLQNMEHCPGAVSAFKENLKNGASEADVAKAAKAVDAYLAIEDKAKTSGATEDDLEEMEDLVDKAKKIIDELGLEGHTYHDMHLERVEDMIDGEDEDDDDEDEMNEAVEDDMPASPDEKSMAMDQAKFLQYVGKEVTQYLEKNKEFPEWMQNKLSGLHEKAKDMHAVLAGDYEDGDMNESNLDEVLDSPEKMDRYRAKAQSSRDRAAKSAVATNLRSKNAGQREHPAKDLKTMAKRTAGLRMADKAAMRKTYKALRKEETVDEAMTASQHRMAMLDKIRKSGVVKTGSMSKDDKDKVQKESVITEKSKNMIYTGLPDDYTDDPFKHEVYINGKKVASGGYGPYKLDGKEYRSVDEFIRALAKKYNVPESSFDLYKFDDNGKNPKIYAKGFKPRGKVGMANKGQSLAKTLSALRGKK